MRMMKMVTATMIMTMAVAVNAQVTVSSIVTVQDVQADYDAKQWAECLKKISQVMPQASPQERTTLLSLRAECLLGQKSMIPAADAFATLATAYAKTTKDVKAEATAKATSEMIRVAQRAGGGADEDLVYVPKWGKDRVAISIVNPATRPAAMQKYFTDQMVATQDSIKNMNFTTQTVLDLAPRLNDLSKVELAVTGDDQQTTAMQKDLALKMKTGITAYVSNSNKAVDSIAKSATTMVPAPVRTQPGFGVQKGNQGNQKTSSGGGPQPQVMRGLSEQDIQKLNTMLADLQKFSSSARLLAASLGVDADYYKTEIAATTTLRKRIDAVLSGKFR